MTKLVMGVVDVPYNDIDEDISGAVDLRTEQKTTGLIAEILEDKYHIMEHYWEAHGQEIGDALVNSLQGALESMAMGAPAVLDPTGTAMSFTKQGFTNYLSNKEMDMLGYPGVPTKAAIEGHSLRFKKKKGPKNRPSFIDTGLYQSSFKSWIETD